jgi:hypothetical protein
MHAHATDVCGKGNCDNCRPNRDHTYLCKFRWQAFQALWQLKLVNCGVPITYSCALLIRSFAIIRFGLQVSGVSSLLLSAPQERTTPISVTIKHKVKRLNVH